MRIAFDAKRFFWNNTGLGNYSRTHIFNMLSMFQNNTYGLYSDKISRRNFGDKTDLLNKKNCQVYTSPRWNWFWRQWGILPRLLNNKEDIFHGLSNELPLRIRKTNIKTVITMHDLIFKVYPKTYKKHDRLLYDFKAKQGCRSANKIIAISENTKKDIIKYYDIPSEKIEVIYQSCSDIYYETTPVTETIPTYCTLALPKEYLLYVGSIEKRKNLKTLVRAYSSLPNDLKIPLIIVGQGKTYKKEVIRLADKLGLSSRLLWIDKLTDKRALKLIYQRAQLLVYPSIYEGFGLPVVEAMLCKTPVITSNVSSLPEAGGPKSFYITPTNCEDIANAIDCVLTNNTLRKKMIATGYDYAKSAFSPNKVSQQMMNCYQKLL